MLKKFTNGSALNVRHGRPTCTNQPSNPGESLRKKMYVGKVVNTLAVASLMAAGLVAVAPGSAALADGLNGTGPIRMAGADRYATSQAISKANFTTAGNPVFLATGTTYPDALAAGPAAGQQKAPVILTTPTALAPAAAQELSRLKPSTIYVMGGTGAVSNAVAQAAKTYSANVVRLSGATRFDTATSVSKRFWTQSDTVYVASSESFADALSGGALAAKMGAPILLTGQNALQDATRVELQRLAPKNVVILGGAGAVSDTVASQVRAAIPAGSVTRLQGADRFGTAAAAAQAGWPASTKAMYAVAWNFPDALAGVAAAAASDAPLLLTNPGCMPAPVWKESQALGVTTKGILGGQGVLSITSVSASCDEGGPWPNASASARSYSGVGDDVISITKPDGATSVGIATATYRGTGDFTVQGLDGNNKPTNGNGFIMGGHGDYVGTEMFDPTVAFGGTVRMAIKATGPWTISIASVTATPTFAKTKISGRGEAVFNYSGKAGSVQLNNSGTGQFAMVTLKRSAGRWDFGNLIVNQPTSPYSGTVLWPAGPTVVAVYSEGAWSANIR